MEQKIIMRFTIENSLKSVYFAIVFCTKSYSSSSIKTCPGRLMFFILKYLFASKNINFDFWLEVFFKNTMAFQNEFINCKILHSRNESKLILLST